MLRDPHEAATSTPEPTINPTTTHTSSSISSPSHTTSAPFQSLAMHASWEEFSSLDGSGDGSFDGWPSLGLFDPSASWDCAQDVSFLQQAQPKDAAKAKEGYWGEEAVGWEHHNRALSGVRVAAEEAGFDGLLGGDLMQCQWGASWGAEGWEGTAA